MSILTLSSAQRSALRAQAHELSPLVMIGEAGLTESVVKEIERTLSAHALIKIRVFSDEKETRAAYAQAICEQLNCALVQHIGKLLVIYRPESKAPKKASLAQSLAGETGTKTKEAGERRVTIVKQEAPNQRPRAKQVVVKGNERVTQGGNVKRAKKKTVSAKKRMA